MTEQWLNKVYHKCTYISINYGYCQCYCVLYLGKGHKLIGQCSYFSFTDYYLRFNFGSERAKILVGILYVELMLQWKIERLKKRETCLSSCIFVPFVNTLPEKEDKDNTIMKCSTNVAVNWSHEVFMVAK